MRRFVFAALFALAACATTGDRGPSLRYADAASRGAWAALLAGRPSQAQVETTTETWTAALRDGFGCDVPMRQVIDAGLVGALEIAAMNAAASGRSEDAIRSEVRSGVGRYVGQIASMALSRRERASDERCEMLTEWAPRIAADGRETVARARRNDLMDEDYGLLLDLLR